MMRNMIQEKKQIRRVEVMGVKVSVVNDSNVIEIIKELVAEKEQIQITTPNAEHILLAQENKEFRQVINESDLAVPDGMWVVREVRKEMMVAKSLEGKESVNRFNRSIQYTVYSIQEIIKKIINYENEDNKEENNIERVTGVDLIEKLCGLAVEKNWKIGLMGADEETRKQAGKNLNKKYEGLRIVSLKSHKNIRQNRDEDEEILRVINKQNIDVLLVAYGAPEQEMWISKNLAKTRVKIAMGVGGAFDFISGKVKRAPVAWQKLGIEWLWRLIQEPWRIKRQGRLMRLIVPTSLKLRRTR